MRQITADAIKVMREESGMGMQEVKKILTKEAMREACIEARTVDDLRPIVEKLIDLI